MTSDQQLARNRFLLTLDIVAREARHLSFSRHRLYAQSIDSNWVRGLESQPETAEILEAFVSRFGRMQDTIAGRLLPRWLMCLAEEPGSQIEILNRAERLGVIAGTEPWLQARQLRNRLVHEYMDDTEAFAQDLLLAHDYSLILFDCYRRLHEFALGRMGFDESELPAVVDPDR